MSASIIRYSVPADWIQYDPIKASTALTEAKAAMMSLKTVPFQRRWVERLQQIELKREVAGTSKIEGADFTDRELDAALEQTPEELRTRSQRQARAALETYRWIATLPEDTPIDESLVMMIHRHIVTGADDDICPPGQIRQRDQNVTFGLPRHRGADGNEECALVFSELVKAIQTIYREHDPLVQAVAAHYHLAAMHPFIDGNGRTARALEAMLLQRAGLRDTSFIAMSNYYYDEKTAYLSALAETRQSANDLTPFLNFALQGIALQCQRLLSEIQHEISKELFRNLALDLFTRLKTQRKRVIAERQLAVLKVLLDEGRIEWVRLIERLRQDYSGLKNPVRALVRDVNYLQALKALAVKKDDERYWLNIRLEWPTEITESTFFSMVKTLPTAKTHSFLPLN